MLIKTIILSILSFGLLAASAQAAYGPGYQWRYSNQFSAAQNPAPDGQGTSNIWEYRYGWNGDGLMGTFHSWETPPTWQMDGNGHNAQIGRSFVQASGGEPLQFRWVSPITGIVNVTLTATGKGGNYSLARFGIGKNGTGNLYDNYTSGDFSWSTTNLAVNAGDYLACSLWTWGGGGSDLVNYQNLQISISIPAEGGSTNTTTYFPGNRRVFTVGESVKFTLTGTNSTTIYIQNYNDGTVREYWLSANQTILATLNQLDSGIYWIVDKDGNFLDTFAVVSPVATLANPETCRFGLHYPIMYRDPSWHAAEFSLYEKIGAVWLRCMATWNAEEVSPGVYDFTNRDMFLSLMEQYGLKMLTTFEYVPDPYVPPYTHLNDVSQYVGAYAQHYLGRLKYYEVWNEANTWTVSDYMTLHQRVYQTVKGVDPQNIVLQTGLASPAYAGQWGVPLLGSVFQDQAFQQGENNYTDIYNFHFYPYQWDTATIVGQYMNVYQARNIRKPVWVTENGMIADITNMSDQRTQAEYLVRSAVTSLSLGVAKYFWFLSIDTPSFPYGLLDSNQRPKAVYVAYGVMTGLLNDATYVGLITGTGLIGYKFTKGTKMVAVLWSSGNPVSTSAFQLGLPTGTLTFIDLMGRKQSIQYYTAFTVTTSPVFMTSNRISGDANDDGAVDVGDLGILAANYGITGDAMWSQGDFNGDGAVDVGDLGILAAHYGEGVNATVDFNTDYAKAFGTTIKSEDSVADDLPSEESGDIVSTICSSLGLSLIAGLLFMGALLVKIEK